MGLFQIFLLITHALQICFTAVPLYPASTVETISTKCKRVAKSNHTLHLHMPFMDLHIEHHSNMHLMQERNGQSVFLLHGYELFQLFMERGNKRLSLIALLSGKVRSVEPLGAEIIAWRSYVILTIALNDGLEIYQIPLRHIQERAEVVKNAELGHETPPAYEPIQELMLHGRFQHFFLLEMQSQQLILIVAVNFTKLYGKLNTYEWMHTYFDPLEQLTVPASHIFQVIGTQTRYLVRGRNNKAKTETILTIYEIRTIPSLSLNNVQTLKVSSQTIHTYSIRNVNYLIACSSLKSSSCSHYHMTNGHFSIAAHSSGKELYFQKFRSNLQFMVGARQAEVRVYANEQFNCYAGFVSNETAITDILIFNNDLKEQYIILYYSRAYNALIRIIDVSADENKFRTNQNELEQNDKDEPDNSFEGNILVRLRSLLLQRKMAMDIFRKIHFVLPMLSGSVRTNEALSLHFGHIAELKIVDSDLYSPIQLLQRVVQLNEQLGRSRQTRSSSNDQQRIMPSIEQVSGLKVTNLQVNNLIYESNIIKGFYFNTTMLEIDTSVSSQTMLNGNSMNGVSNMTINSLNVISINGLDWNDFYKTLYLKNRDSIINGTLIMQNMTRVVNLWAETINKQKVADFFNLKQPQNISSNLVISQFLVTDLKADTVNGLDFAKDIVFKGQNTLIETPVSLHRLSIAGDLLVTEDAKLNRQAQAESNFKQYYMGKVVINGSLIVKSLQRDDAQQTKMFINKNEISERVLRERYLLTNESQTFRSTVTFGQAKVVARSLTSAFLNNHPTEQHLLKSQKTLNSKIPMLLILTNASIQGDITSDQKTKLLELSENLVRRGHTSNITGLKIFETALKVQHLMTLALNKQPVKDLILRIELQSDIKFNGVKVFEKLAIQKTLYIEKALASSHLNNLPLNKLLSQDYYITHLTLPHSLTVSNIVFQKINGIAFEELFAKFHVENEQLVLHKDLIFEGYVQFNENLNINYINDIDWTLYEQSLVRFNEDVLISGRKIFLSELTVAKQLRAPTINKIELERLFEKILSRSSAQTIMGHYIFESLQSNQMELHIINDVSTEAFIDMRSQHVEIDGDLIAAKLIVYGHLTGVFVHQLQPNLLETNLKELLQLPWQNLFILGNAQWNASTEYAQQNTTELHYLYRNAVQRQTTQIISGNVRLINPIIREMRSNTNAAQIIDIDFIAHDCLLKRINGNEQILIAGKTFTQPLKLTNFKTTAQLHSSYLNEIDIISFNNSLYRQSDSKAIVGPLIFRIVPTISKLHVQGLLNERRIDQIYEQSSSVLPTVKILNLTIENTLDIQNVNGINFDEFLAHRIQNHAETMEIFGHLTFEHLILNKVVKLQSINGISIDNLVLKQSQQLQAIVGSKYINGTLTLEGPAHAMHLNSHDVIDNFRQTIFKDRNQHFDQLTVGEATFKGGLLMLDSLLAANNTRNTTVLAEAKMQLTYMDYDFDMKVSWQNPKGKITKSKLFELERLSRCEHKLIQLQHSETHNHIYLSNITTKFIMQSSGDSSIKAENYCKSKYRSIKSKITLTTEKSTKIFGMKKFIENIFIHTSVINGSATAQYVLLHAIDALSNRSEVRILKLNLEQNSLLDWQSLTLGVDCIIKFFDFDRTYLISSCLLHGQSTISIYMLQRTTEKFKLLQVIDNSYNNMEMVELSLQKYHLILTCRQCKYLQIYEFDERQQKKNNMQPFQSYQIVKVNQTFIDKLRAFTASDGERYLFVLGEHGQSFYHVYKYMHGEGWRPFITGFWSNIQFALPLIDNKFQVQNEDLLLVLCDYNSNCSVVRAIIH